MWHGGGQSGKTWESTTDGREGYQSIFLRRNFTVHIIDQPRRGRAGNSTQPATLTATPGDQDLFVAWRLGIWPNFYPNTKFPRGADALDQFFRQFTVDTGPSDRAVVTDGAAALFAKIGPAVLLTHSASGVLGWVTATKSANVRAIYAYEPTDYVFPDTELPNPIGTGVAQISPNPVPMSDFLKLTKIPIRMQYSDGIPPTSSPYPRVQTWINRIAMGRLMVKAINKHGGNASLLHLPDIGIFGNTHFSFADVNNIQIADILSDYLQRQGLDRY
ncbi:alpha/beta hydrolase [Methylocella silvestris]|nr:alpha/beta fold hydrolase [Methylocella silvestris]